jgi:micrococcal nuclease
MVRRLLILLALAIAGSYGASSLIQSRDGDSGVAPLVSRVVDGDTIVLEGGTRVRYIGVDTPESVKPGTPVQCYAKAASRFNARLLDGERVQLRYDAERTDRYGRTLAYVYRVRDGLFINAELVRRGYATTLTIAPNVAHADEFTSLARDARRHGRGLWSSC